MRPGTVLADSDVVALAQILRLEDRREFVPERFAAFIGHANPEVRRRAALAAGRIGDRRATPLLLRALDDRDPAVRADAAFALGELGDTAMNVVLALTRHAQAPGRERHPTEAAAVAAEAVAALGKLGTPAARQAVERVLAGPHVGTDGVVPAGRSASPAPAAGAAGREGGAAAGAHRDVLKEALLALARFPRQPHSADLVLPHLGANDPELRWRAAYVLMRLGDPRTVAALRARLADEDPLVRATAARALRASVVDSAGERAATIPALLAALNDRHPHVRINALRALATYRDAGPAPAVARHLAEPDTNVAITAAEALGQLGGETAAAALESVVTDERARLAFRGTALAALLRVAPARGARHATALGRAENWLARLYAARALAAATWRDAEPALRRLLDDPDPRVAAAAMESVVAIAADTVPAAYALYIEGLASADPLVRAAALRGLERRAEPADLPLILDAYDGAQRDTLNDAAVAAIDALGALVRHGVPANRSFYLRFPRSPDPVVRKAAADRLGPGSWGDPWPVETGRDPGFYERVVRELVVPALAAATRPRLRILTPHGPITVELAAELAPLTVDNILALVRQGYFRQMRWHRVVPNFVLQDGDPRGDGNGGPGYAIRDELNRIRYLRGTVGMALSGPDTGGSQFFITLSPQPHLDGGYTAFGRVVAGMGAADQVLQDDPIEAIELLP